MRPKAQTPSPLSLHGKYREFHPRFDAFPSMYTCFFVSFLSGRSKHFTEIIMAQITCTLLFLIQTSYKVNSSHLAQMEVTVRIHPKNTQLDYFYQCPVVRLNSYCPLIIIAFVHRFKNGAYLPPLFMLAYTK